MEVVADSLLVDHFPRFQALVQERALSQPTSQPGSKDQGGKSRLLSGHRRGEQAAAEEKSQAGFMKDFFSQIRQIQEKVDRGRKVVQGMSRMVEEAMLATTKDRERAVSDCLETAAEEVRVILSTTKTALEQLKEQSDAEEAQQPGRAQGKIRANMQLAMGRKHQQLLKDFQKVQMDFKQVLEQRQQKEMMLLMPEATIEEVRQMIQDGETSSQVIMQKMAGAHAVIMDEVNRIQEKHRDIQKLEKSIAELAELFQECAVLVDAQGELLNSIEVHVENSKSYTQKATVELGKARDYQKNTRKWTCCAMICMTLIAVAILVPILIKAA